MKHEVIVSAPGKLMILGEHAVVYGRPCLVTAISQRIKIRAVRLKQPVVKIDAPDVNLLGYEKRVAELGKGAVNKGAKFIETAAANFFEKYPVAGGAKLETVSDFFPKFGLGSSSSVIVCAIKSLSDLFDVGLDSREIFDLSYRTILDIQGKGSGFDVAAAVYGGTLYFVSGGKIIEPIAIETLPLIVGYSGVKADTVTLIEQVAQKAKIYPRIINGVYDQIAAIVENGKIALKNENWDALGDLMNFNQGYLESLGVGTKKLSDMVWAAIDAGARGAKISGAGGGDCIVALAGGTRAAVESAIEAAGGEIIKVEMNAPGVKVEQCV